MKDPIVAFLEKRGCPDYIVREGLKGLVVRWENAVHSVASVYGLGLDNYLNDMDTRQLIEEILAAGLGEGEIELRRRIEAADAHLRQLVRPFPQCLWGNETARTEGWTPAKNWWYFTFPLHPGEELRRDVDVS